MLATDIKFDSDGFVFMDIAIKPKNSTRMEIVKYKVDSGANCTTIGFPRLKALGYDEGWVKAGELLIGNTRPTVASGYTIDDCYRITLPEINLSGEWIGYNWPVITSLTIPFKFLLGTDTMRFFNWNFDYENNICKFDLIPGKRKAKFNQKEQSIHALDDIDIR